MRRYRATLAYDGTAYNGYQIQPNVPTVQGELERVVTKILGTTTTIWAAGRTDAGVHATGQVIAFDAEWKHEDDTLLRAINANLPDDIALQDIQQQAGFHPRFDALSRTYRYEVAVVHVRQPLLARRAWQLHHELDELTMQKAASTIIGEHDFAAFGNPPQGENTVREVFRSVWHVEKMPVGERFIYEVEATAYLHHMVRRLVGTQVAVGQGRLNLDGLVALLNSADLSQNKWMAPPQGLSLTQVRYPPPGISRDTYQQSEDWNIGGTE